MFQKFILKKMLTSKLAHVPEVERDKLLNMVEKNPELFTKIATEVKTKTDQGMDQMTAVIETVKTYQDQLKSAL
jgi:hypothetical protein